jgi:ribonuclease P protein component
LPRERRLRRSGDIQALRRRGSSQPHFLVTLRAARNSLPYSRFGFVVGRRVAKAAVARNLLRRRMREVVRRAGVREGWDLLYIARPPAAMADFEGVRQAVMEVTQRADLLVGPEKGSDEKR